jgi:hypothetical protein
MISRMNCRKSVIGAIFLAIFVSLQIGVIKVLELYKSDIDRQTYELVSIVQGLFFDVSFFILGILGFRLRGQLERETFTNIKFKELSKQHEIEEELLQPKAPPYRDIDQDSVNKQLFGLSHTSILHAQTKI